MWPVGEATVYKTMATRGTGHHYTPSHGFLQEEEIVGRTHRHTHTHTNTHTHARGHTRTCTHTYMHAHNKNKHT